MNYKEEIYKIVGAAMEVHKELKHCLPEAVYQEALEYELNERGIKIEREVQVPVVYKKQTLQKYYQLDFLYDDCIILELKSTPSILSEHRFQLFTYLRLTKKPYGILINFGEPSLHIERYRYALETNDCVGFLK
ncbi:MAG: GxxExxY protein [Prevotellaceae bacterium]|nr:GxxExxY protein [Prevotellaceae bacterium]